MKRVFKSILVVLVTLMAAVPVLSACDRGGSDIDTTRTQLYVGVYDGGLSANSLYTIKYKFEQKYKDVELEPGKKGVQVMIVPSRAYSDTLKDTIKDFKIEVFVSSSANAKFLGQKGLLLDISDVYNTSMQYDFVRGTTNPELEDVLYKDKIRTDIKNYFKESDGKYYGFFTPTLFYGLIYDIDLFEENLYYFNPQGEFVQSLDEERSGGPDGNPETEYDNGLPATYDQFFRLCDKMVEDGITPVMWGGTVQEYVSSLLIALATDHNGKEQAELNYNYDGTARNLITGFDANGNPIIGTPKLITAKNGYELYKQEGRYYALKFLERLVSNPDYYNEDATNNAFTHTDAEDAYIYSKFSNTRKRTAMLIDGNWWQKEAESSFDALVAEKGDSESYYNRRFGMLPLPKATEAKVGEPYTIIEYASGDGFVNGNIAAFKIPLAKAFVQFLATNESLVDYLAANFVAMPFEIDVGDRIDELSPWAKSMLNINTFATIATMYNKSKIFQNYSTDLWWSERLWTSKIGGTTYNQPSIAMINYGITARQYFEGLANNWTETVWKNKFVNV